MESIVINQIWSLAGHEVVAVAAGKHRSAVASAMGAVYMWDALAVDAVPHPVRIPGLHQAVDLSMGESHSIAICTLSIPAYALIEHVEGELGDLAQRLDGPGEADSEGDFKFEDATQEGLCPGRKVPIFCGGRELPSLKEICEEVIAKTMVEPKNVLLMLELADSLGAHNLKHYCEMLVLKNLDYVLSISAPMWGQARLSILADLERVLADYTTASDKWLNRRVPKPSGVPLSSLVLDEDDAGAECGPSSAMQSWAGALVSSDRSVSEWPQSQGAALAFLHQYDGTPNAISKQLRTVRRKLQQIEVLEIRQAKGMVLDAQQLEKVGRKDELLAELDYLEAGADPVVGGLKIGRFSGTDSPPWGSANDLEEDDLELVSNASAKKQKHRSRRKGKPALSNASTFCSGGDVDSGIVKKYQQPGDTRCARRDEVVRQLDYATCAAAGVPFLVMDRAQCDGGRMAGSSVGATGGTVTPVEMSPMGSQSSTAAEPPATSVRPLKVLGRRKGGSSVFLKGELDALPTPSPLPPPKPKAQGPAWGGLGLANQLKGESLRTIQIEQGNGGAHYSKVLRGVVVPATAGPSSTSNLCTRKDTEAGGGLGKLGKKGTCPVQSGLEDPDSGQHRIALSDFLKKKSAPIAIKGAPRKARGVAKGKKGGPPDEVVLPWGRSPGETSTPSLRDIQEQQAEQYDFSRSQHIAVRSIKLGFRDFARELVGVIGTEVGHRLDKTERFCAGAIEGVKAAAPKEEEARPPRREPVKVKFPDSYSGKREENFDNWEANVKTYVHLQQVSPDQQVLIAIHALRDEAASFARSLVRTANCSDDPVAYSSFTSLVKFLKLLRERFTDVARSVKASDKLQTIHSRKWKSARALKGTMDELVAVPDHGVTEGQLVNLFYRAMIEAFRGQFFAKSEDPATTYDSLSREVVALKRSRCPDSCPETACVRVSLDTSLTSVVEELKERMPAWAKMKKENKGQLILLDTEVFRSRFGALVDSGATRSYISRKVMQKLKLGLKVQKLADPIVSILADNLTMVVEEYVEGVQAYFRLEKNGKVEKVLHSLTLLVEDSLPFDIVLGMDWGEAVGATLHLKEHECRLPSSSGEAKTALLFHVSGVENSLAHCCLSAPAFAILVKKEKLEEQVFVAYVRPVTEPTEEKLKYPAIAKLLEEFKDLTEPSTGTVSRPIQHRIEIEPGSRSPKGAVYRMSPRELEELRKPWLDRFVVVYLDDILVFSRTPEEHQGHLRQVLEKLREANFKINAKKCDWAKTQVLYLGHFLDRDGVKPEDSKIAAIRDWPTPRTLTELRSFLGLANYYRKFVRNFSTIAAPLRKLLRKETIWKWDKDCTSAMKKLKQALIEYPVLKVADPSLPFVVTTDASQYDIGAVLQQDDGNGYRPVEFMPARMPSEKVATSTYERELYALRQALDHWKHYLLGRHFKVYSDHETLRWLKTQAKMTPKLTRWAAEIDQYDFELKPVKGKYNVVADALSRRADYFGVIVHYLDIGKDLQQKVREAYAQDPIYSDLLKKVKEAPETEPNYRSTEGLLFEKISVFDRVCIPNSEEIRSLILGECHDTEGHFGWQKTLANLMCAYTWPGMKNDCVEYVRSCKVCQRNKSSTRAPLGLLRPLPIPDQPGDSVSIDFMDTHVKSRHGKSQVMVIVDCFSKYAVFVPLPSEARTDLVIQRFFDCWVSENGIPLSIVSDRDSRFTSQNWQELMGVYGSKLLMSSGRHPETNGQTEQMNKILQQVLRMYIRPDQINWDEMLPKVASAYNNSVHLSTCRTPNELHKSFRPRRPFEGLNRDQIHRLPPGTREFAVQHEKELATVVENLRKAQHRMIEEANKHRRPSQFQVGDLVWVSSKEFAPEEKISQKLLPTHIEDRGLFWKSGAAKMDRPIQ
ncbi:hypothetical protein CBR_g37359 [Chara braunii]|uniref:RNA-directed DNA polymerase n=1 Tax=Chara braunii TaxID=69332 RepID=A0A388JZZ9_CHABU|nr:hypothetical protein CBR_g37359 [Chara braunii]|eukprot:GBG63273.1 hypothetical protein CBR_g37359 [Chara braunii]